MMKEIPREITNANGKTYHSIEGWYYADDERGEIWSQKSGKWLKGSKNQYGYLQVGLQCEEGKKPFYVQRLIWESFNDQIPQGLEVNHINENKEDNRLCNLNLMTHPQNINHGTRSARSAAARSKPVNRCDVDGNILETYPSTAEAQRQGFHSGAVSQCCNGKLKTHKGYRWSYA